MYSEKVMEHFRNPRNVGEIENPDGVGEVGNPVCFPPSTLVHLNPNIRTIDALTLKDRVLGHDGKYHGVKKVFKRNYSGELLRIRVGNLGTFEVTPDHLILGLKLSYWPHKFKMAEKQVLDWHAASELEKGDFLAFPIPKEEIDIDTIKIELEKLDYDFRSRELPEEIEVDADFLRLAGFYLAEGYVRTDKSKGTLGFVFGSNERDYVTDIQNTVKKKFGILPGIVTEKNNSIHVPFYNVHLARFFEREFGKGALDKRIPQWIQVLPPVKQRALIRGLWNGDGYLNQRGAKFVTISEKLAHQLKLLLLRQRLIFSFLENSENGIHKKHYSIYVKEQDSLVKMAEILGKPYSKKARRKYPKKSWYDDNYYYVPVRKIERVAFSGDVFNLEVDRIHSYAITSACVHNCGDMMKITIKVEDDRIADIKFQTLGCGAAIATSSMVTEMAMGKTLDEAMAISKQAVAEALDGLPPAKMHCSVLAADGLHAAIEDYRNRKKQKEASKA